MASPFSRSHRRTGSLNWQIARWPQPALPLTTEKKYQVTTSLHLCECVFIVWVSSGRRWIKHNNCLVPAKTLANLRCCQLFCKGSSSSSVSSSIFSIHLFRERVGER